MSLSLLPCASKAATINRGSDYYLYPNVNIDEGIPIMSQALPKKKMYRYCLADIAKGLFNGMIGNYLLYFFQPTVKSGLPNLLPQSKLLGFITVMALITGIGKVVDAVTDPLVASLSDK
ncbi:MAG: hypothetical protein ACI4IE_01220, partial [Eubacterium sp.]